MKKPYVICHMLCSIDGKVTGEFLKNNSSIDGSYVYYEINRNYKADAFVCGRITMQESFTGDYYPDLINFEPVLENDDYVASTNNYYAISFDPKGKVGWKTSKIIDPDEDPGYHNAHIIEVVTENVNRKYLSYLKSIGVSYIFGGKEKINVIDTLMKLNKLFSINVILLEGGSVINGTFIYEDAIDELSLVISPVTSLSSDKSLFNESVITKFKLNEIKRYDNDIIWLNYKK